MAKTKEILIRSDKHNLVVSKKLSVKSVLRHSVVLAFLILATVTLFQLNINDVQNLIKHPEIAIETFMVYFLMYFQLRNTIRMINFSNSTMYFSIVASALSIGYAIFLYFVLQETTIDSFVELRRLVWYYLPMVGLLIVWKVCQIFFERKPNPMISRALIISSISSAAWGALLIYVYYITSWYVFDDTKVFNMSDIDTVLNVIACAGIGVLFLTTSLATKIFRRRHQGKSVLKMSIGYTGALMLLVPFSIWFSYFSFRISNDWESITYLCAFIFLACLAIFIGLFWKQTLGSPTIIATVYTVIITVAWAISMLVTIMDPSAEKINYLFSKICPLIVTVIIMILIYIKNPRVAFVELMAWVFILASMIYWLLEEADFQGTIANLKDSGIQVDSKTWSLLLLIDGVTTLVPTGILAINVIKWYSVQRTIKTKSSKANKIKKIVAKKQLEEVEVSQINSNDSKDIKEAAHA